MTKGRKTGGRNFQKGVQTYFSKLSEEDKQLRAMTRTLGKTVIARNALLNYKELKEKLKNDYDDLTCIELLVCRCLQKAIDESDTIKLDWFFKTWFGKDKEKIQEEKRITIKIEDQNGNAIGTQDLKNCSTEALKAIVEGILLSGVNNESD